MFFGAAQVQRPLYISDHDHDAGEFTLSTVGEGHPTANRPAAGSDRPKRDIGSYGMAAT